jgi:hypothetical protein
MIAPLEHMIESAVVHGLIYRVLSSLMRGMGVPGTIAFAVAGIGGVYLYRKYFSRRA